MNALERMIKQQELAVQVIEKLGLKHVFSIQFTNYEVTMQTKFEELALVEGSEIIKINDGLHSFIKVDDVEIWAYRKLKEEEMTETEAKKLQAHEVPAADTDNFDESIS